MTKRNESSHDQVKDFEQHECKLPEDTKKRKKICLYVDQESEQGRKVIEDLDNAGIRYATVPVSSSIPRASFGRAHFVGAGEISHLIESEIALMVP